MRVRRLHVTDRAQLRLAVCLGLALSAGGCERGVAPEADAGTSEAGPAIGVLLDAEQQRKLGIEVARLAAAEFEERVEGPAVVVDAQTVIQRMSDLRAAEAAERQSAAAEERARKLFGADASVSREVLEQAESQAAADRAKLDVAHTQASVAFGYDAPWLDTRRRGALLGALKAGKAIIVRASFPGGLPDGVPAHLALRRIGTRTAPESRTSTEVWLGPADPAVPGPVLFAYVDRPAGLVAGERVVASVGTGTKLGGTLVPAAAVVIAGGTAWCYVRRGQESFVREAVSLDRPLGGGYFQAETVERPDSETEGRLKAGQLVVSAGAGLLLARETGGAEEED